MTNMSYTDSFVTLNYDKHVIVTHNVLKLRGEFIKPLADVHLIASKKETAKCRGFPFLPYREGCQAIYEIPSQ